MMLRLVPVIVALIVVAAPAAADYPTCMRLCMSQQPFQACHDTCKGLATEAPSAGTDAPATPDAETGSPAAAPKAAESLPPIPDVLKGRDCSSTRRHKADALAAYIWKTYEPFGYGIFPLRDHEETFEVGFFQRDKQRYCRAWMEITDECRLSIIARSDLRPSLRPLSPETGSYFVKVEHGELTCVFATE